MRNLETTLPSPSELGIWQKCQTRWVFEYGLGWKPREKGIGLVVGAGCSEALSYYYQEEQVEVVGEVAITVYNSYVTKEKEKLPNISDEEWLPAINCGREVLKLYCNTYERRPKNWNILGVQVRLEKPAPMVLDMLVEQVDTEEVVVVEQKTINPFADLEFEILKYQMGWQPICYTVGAAEHLGRPVYKVIMDWLVKGSPAKRVNGRQYKAIAPALERKEITVEPWKQEMWWSTATYENALMRQMREELEYGSAELVMLPKKTESCVFQLGRKTFQCPFYLACSVNMHPEGMTELLVNKREERDEPKSSSSVGEVGAGG